MTVLPRALARVLALCLLATASPLSAQPSVPQPVPRMQAVPQPDAQIAFERDGEEITRYHFGPDLRRPFLFPAIGPSGRSLTRLGHPHDPEGHSHHNSIWITHHDVNGQSFWGDRNAGRIVHQRVQLLEDAADHAAVTTVNHWVGTNQLVLLVETRRTAVHWLPKKEWLLVLDLKLEAKGRDVVLGKTSFGPVAARMAKSIGVNDGGGRLLSSTGGVNEKELFWRPARWMDYSGPVTAKASEGITLMDHPENPGHPCAWHVRNDGWMGAALTFSNAVTITPARPLRLRYGLYVHGGVPGLRSLEQRWQEFVRLPAAELEPKKK